MADILDANPDNSPISVPPDSMMGLTKAKPCQ